MTPGTIDTVPSPLLAAWGSGTESVDPAAHDAIPSAALRRREKPSGSCLANFRHLRAFLAVCQTGSIHAAAERVHRAKSSVTRSIMEIEQVLGVGLFERRASGMVCNAYGSAMHNRVVLATREFAAGLHAVTGVSARTGDDEGNFPSSLFHESRLEAFITMAEFGHVQAVASKLHVTQPVITRAINELERDVGTRLFQRTVRGMTPTTSGKIFAFHTRRALIELNRIASDLDALRGKTRGRVVVGALPLGRTAVLPAALARLLDTCPDVQISTVEGPYDTLADRLLAGDIDLIVGALRPVDPASGLRCEALFDDGIRLVVRGDHPLTGIGCPALHDTAAARWILPPPEAPARALLDAAFTTAHLAPPVPAVETGDLALLRGLLLQTDLVAAASPRQLAHEIASGLLAVLDIPLPAATRSIGITRRDDAEPSSAAAALMNAIRVQARTGVL